MSDTRSRIFEKALEMFNEQGIEYVGMRELAASLDLRIGNITYYFPTKDDLVFAISKAYTDSNSHILKGYPVKTLYDFLSRTREIFGNGVRYRCLMLSMVHIMDQNALVSEAYKSVAQQRSAGLAEIVKILKENKYIKIDDTDAEWFLVSINSLIGRFWYSEAALNAKRAELHTYISHYLRLEAQLFKPYATKKGLADIQRFLGEL